MKTTIFSVNYKSNILYIGQYKKVFNVHKIKSNLKTNNKRLCNLLKNKFNVEKNQIMNSININKITEYNYSEYIEVICCIHRFESVLNPYIRRNKNLYL